MFPQGFEFEKPRYDYNRFQNIVGSPLLEFLRSDEVWINLPIDLNQPISLAAVEKESEQLKARLAMSQIAKLKQAIDTAGDGLFTSGVYNELFFNGYTDDIRKLRGEFDITVEGGAIRKDHYGGKPVVVLSGFDQESVVHQTVYTRDKNALADFPELDLQISRVQGYNYEVLLPKDLTWVKHTLYLTGQELPLGILERGFLPAIEYYGMGDKVDAIVLRSEGVLDKSRRYIQRTSLDPDGWENPNRKVIEIYNREEFSPSSVITLLYDEKSRTTSIYERREIEDQKTSSQFVQRWQVRGHIVGEPVSYILAEGMSLANQQSECITKTKENNTYSTYRSSDKQLEIRVSNNETSFGFYRTVSINGERVDEADFDIFPRDRSANHRVIVRRKKGEVITFFYKESGEIDDVFLL